jgi:hypothetical protein
MIRRPKMKRIAVFTLPLAVLLAGVGHAQQEQAISAGTTTPAERAPYGHAYDSTSVSPTSYSSRGALPAETTEAVLLVPGLQMSEQHRGELTADLDIMCVLLDRLLGDAGLATCTWGPRVGRYRRSARSLYLSGLGALFLLEAEFPLVAPPATETSTEEETTDALWAEVRENMRSQSRHSRSTSQRTRAQYDELKVQSLKRTLERAVAHCTNLRHLAPDDRIIVLAISASHAPTASPNIRFRGAYGSYYPRRSPTTLAPTDVLAIQTTKQDVDALASGQASAADFQGRVQTLTYELPLLQAQSTARPR